MCTYDICIDYRGIPESNSITEPIAKMIEILWNNAKSAAAIVDYVRRNGLNIFITFSRTIGPRYIVAVSRENPDNGFHALPQDINHKSDIYWIYRIVR